MSDATTPATNPLSSSPTLSKTTDALLENQQIIPSGYNSTMIKEDIGLMMNFATNSGLELPDTLIMKEELDSTALLNNYNTLRKAIAPATVRSIRYINTQMILAGEQNKWYKIPIFTKCVVIAVIALIALISISLSPIVNEVNQARGLLESSGLTLLYNLIFICAASLLGVMFYLLKTFGDKIREYTLVPSNAIELNASILIGVISGFVISELFAYTLEDISSQYIEIRKMTLALLGGFSSDAIFSTLQGIVNKFKKLVSS